ncbi:protein NKG7 [Anolis carolinensis]|nr:PREDICTED: protein NKG7 [Anolis carolinensis]|eukprot:XP_008115512.1 PREDICTED: protein NKG7 [Anolis carolinensis]
MLACRVFSMVLTATSLVLLLMALITDYWLVAYGTNDIVHSGLWKWCRDGNCFVPEVTFDYIVATRAFLIMACLMSLAAIIAHIAFFAPCDCGILDKPFFALVAAFTAGLFTLIAVAVFTAESWGKNENPQIQLTFEWSFYLAWGAFPMLLLAGIFSLVVQLCSSRSGYNNL